ncbi:alpha-1,4-glucan--maltose-1-phosphate maltosyltransferase [Modestobacter muralis]|uniref:Alpha-1,4-glucan:maltose-1-phosphate maltosyltransferase n=1 Tax=Modestobacter muralis TaxID=1608614 RepID=A0A6P0EYW8_9ACTN|nr:alpha-1,4-glucan--maltose-1-phosphate maltosyltransferase [Modestobacter muralis]NEK95676.1 alpha-1,4-glucan--maltose-1-phosphate maltosyltransferase [Modestobacter muralis]NEN52564.1 alpha-1,4-glucan--maltose-1-phosphate maltosyltransferase [Modestobacter muralis]
MTGRADLRLGISDVAPVVSCGSFSTRAVVGEHLPITATVFREGHDAVAASVVLTPPAEPGASATPVRTRMVEFGPEPDRWTATVVPDREGLWTYQVEAWDDPLSTWHHDVEVKIEAGQGAEELANDLESGARLLEEVAAGVSEDHAGVLEHRADLTAAAAALRDESLGLTARIAPALSPSLQGVLHAHPVRRLVTGSQVYELYVDRPRALYGSWYEFFPRSEGPVVGGTPTHGTFAQAAERLPAIADMGFDVVYLPPIHPIGTTNRKGKNNTLVAHPDDVGSPWAIGSPEGGHDAVHPQLGTMEDFVAFVERTKSLGMEVALDFALQATPDHPWVTSHPEWFTTKPDGTIAYAENPPKKYQDIYPINFDNDPEGIYAECLRVIRVWIEAGVRIFRVDNPHTKPLNFWNWLIWEVKKTDSDVLFLAEAFTRPAMMHQLARVGFTQSYTYFTWRTEAWELREYGEELAANAHYMRPNFFVNTPDILHETLQVGGPPMFKIRAALAAMMSPTWGVYSGYELFEHVGLRPGSEEYLDTEKFQLRPRDWAAAEASGRSLAPYLRRLNEIRRAHPALQQLRTLRFHAVDNPDLLVFSKTDPASDDAVLVVVSLNSSYTQIGTTALDMPALGLDWSDRFAVTDEITGAHYDWGQTNYVELDPHREPAHVFTVHRSLPTVVAPQ